MFKHHTKAPNFHQVIVISLVCVVLKIQSHAEGVGLITIVENVDGYGFLSLCSANECGRIFIFSL